VFSFQPFYSAASGYIFSGLLTFPQFLLPIQDLEGNAPYLSFFGLSGRKNSDFMSYERIAADLISQDFQISI
jgi:hypothetical protein